MDTDFSSGLLDYSSAELKRNLNGYHLAHGYYFIAHGSQIFSSGPFIFWTRIKRIKRIFFIRTIGLFHLHGKSVSIRVPKTFDIRAIRVQRKNPCSSIRVPKTFVLFERFVFKKKSVFIHPYAKNIRVRERFVFKKNLCSSIRVPKTFVLESDSCSKKICVHLCHLWENKIIIRVQRKAVRPSPTHQCRTQTDYLYLICHARGLPFPSPDTTITSSHHFTTFLPFTIYIPWGKLLIPAPVAMRLPSRV